MPHSAQEKVDILIFEGSQRAADRVLGPALRIALHRIVKESIERRDDILGQRSYLQFTNEINRLAHHKIILVAERLPQRHNAHFLGLLTQRIERSKLFFKSALPGHTQGF